MPVTGNEEVGVKPSLGQYSEYTAGIPIKKRRFPFILSPSQPAENLPSLPTENKMEQKGFSSTLRCSTVLNESSVAASSDPTDVLLSSHTSGVLSSSDTSGIAGSSKSNVINTDGVTSSLDTGSFAASSNASGVAMSSTSVAAGSNAGSVAASSNASGVELNSSVISAAAGLNAGSVATISGASGGAMSSKSISVAAGLNAENVVDSFNASGGAMSSISISVAAGLNAGTVADSFNASSGAMSSASISEAAGLNAGADADSFNASSVARGSTAISVTAGSITDRVMENPIASSVAGNVLASALGFSESSEKSLLEKEKRASDDTDGSMVQGNTILLRVEREEQSFTVHSRSLSDIGNKGKLVESGASGNIPGTWAKSELDMVGDDSLTFNIEKDTYSQENVGGAFGEQLPEVPGNPGLSLGLGEYLSATASGNNDQCFRNREKQEPVSLNLSLSKVDYGTELRSSEVQPYTEGANMLADRTNWDLNTTMDSWEGPGGDDGASKMTNHMDDMKSVICSAEIAAASMPAQQQMHEEVEHRAKIETSSTPSSQQYNNEDSLCLGLTTPYLHLTPNEKPSGFSVKVVSSEVVANNSSPGKPVPASNPNMVNYKPVKSEPHDESVKGDSAIIKAKPMGLLNITQVKSEIIDKFSENLKSSTPSTLNSVDAGSLKPEPVCESNKETPERMEGPMNQSDEQMLAVPTFTDSSFHGGVTTRVEHFMQAKETERSDDGQVASKTIYSAGHDVNESNIAGTLDNSTSQCKKVEDPDHCSLKSIEVKLHDSRGSIESSVSDEEKINLSGDVLEEDSYGSDYESDVKRELAAAVVIDHDRREDDFEDGEVREPVENIEIEVPICERKETVNRNSGDTIFMDFVDPSSSFSQKENQREDPGLTGNGNTDECIDSSLNKDSTTEADKEDCMQEPSAIEMPSIQVDKKTPVEALPRKLQDVSGNNTVKGQEGEHSSIQASDTSLGTSVTIVQGEDDARSSEGKFNSVLPKVDAFSNVGYSGKDVDNGGRRRIINLSRASNLSSTGRTRFISGRTLQSQVGRERLPDVALEGDEFHPRGRDEAYTDSSHRFPRERHHIQPARNNRINFMRGRGRVSSRIDTLRGDQDSECNLAGSTEFRVVRNKYASAVSDADLNYSSYKNGQDGAYFGTGRCGRKILNDDPSIFHQLPSRRRSPGGRDGPAGRGLPRNLSPSRCIGEDVSEIDGLRHMRGFSDDDHTNPMFARCQPSYEGLGGPFVRGNREFTSVQRRGLPQFCSKSPTRPRTRSPGPWSSLRRRSPDGFGGPLELHHRRSPPIYRMEKVRSPDRSCFTGDMGIRRNGSPYLSRPSNDLRDMDPRRDHGHRRSGISNRSPSGRILHRNRRLNLDLQERNGCDDFFGGPVQSGRFHELGTDGNADERRYGDRRGPVHSFRSPYSVADSENFHLNTEAGCPRSFRFCPEDDPEPHERGNMREREFDRRIKKRPGNAPRRTQNIEEHEGNFRHGGQVWQDDGFEDMSQVKRKRF